MIHTIDLEFLGQPKTIAAYLLESEAGPILFETGPYSTFPVLEKAIKGLGYAVEDIQHVFLTHVHLDHAGAAWAFAKNGAKVYVHPVGIQHMHDPSKLMASASRIYQDQMERLWSTMNGIPMDQLLEIEHGSSIIVGEHEIKAWYTPGHATHHIAWQIEEHLIAGDVAGIKIGLGPVVPPCPPPDINIEDWKASITILKNLNLSAIYLAHFGKVEDVKSLFEELEKGLEDWAAWMLPHYTNRTPKDIFIPKFQEYVAEYLIEKGVDKKDTYQYESANPSWMSAVGLMRYWKKKHEAK